MNTIPKEQWPQVVAGLKKQCPRLTSSDLADSERRIDLLTAFIQNRHWTTRIAARRTVLGVLQQCGGIPVGS